MFVYLFYYQKMLMNIFLELLFFFRILGKEMILRRYINEESPDLSANRPGFLNVAMNHLKEKTNRPRHSKR